MRGENHTSKDINNNPPQVGRAWDDVSGPAKAFRRAYEKTNLTVWCTKKLFITALKPNLNVQSDYIRAEVFSSFVFTVLYFCFARFV